MFGNSSGNLHEPTWVPKWLRMDFCSKLYHFDDLGFLRPFERCDCWYSRFKKRIIWRTNFGPRPDYTINGVVLRTKSHLISVHTVSSTLKEASLPQFTPFKASTVHAPKKINNNLLFNTIFQALTSVEAKCLQYCHSARSFPTNFRHIFGDNKREGLQHLDPSVLAWLDLNETLDIYGHSLKSRVATPKGVHDTFRFMVPCALGRSCSNFLKHPLDPLFAPPNNILAASREVDAYLLQRMQNTLKL